MYYVAEITAESSATKTDGFCKRSESEMWSGDDIPDPISSGVLRPLV